MTRAPAAIAVAIVAFAGLAQDRAQSATAERKAERLIRIPAQGTSDGMLTRLCLPETQGPWPLVIINHGSPKNAEDRQTRRPMACGTVSRFFTSRGYAVAFPLRRGYGETGGRWAEAYGPCDRGDFVAGGNATADDIATALAYLLRQPNIAKGRTVIVGQSAGGWGTLAFASRNPDGVAAFINFAGTRGGYKGGKPNNNCSPDALVRAAGVFGKTTRQRSLWIYTANDTFIGTDLQRRVHAAYTAAGGRAQFERLPAFRDDGHNLFTARGGLKVWGPIVERWLASKDAPTAAQPAPAKAAPAPSANVHRVGDSLRQRKSENNP